MYCHVCGTENPDSAPTCYHCHTPLAQGAKRKAQTSGVSGKKMTTENLLSVIGTFYNLMSSQQQTFDRVLAIEEELKPLKDTGNSYDPIGSNQLTQKDIEKAQSSIGGMAAWIPKWWNGLLKGAGCYTVIAFLLFVGFISGLVTSVAMLFDGSSPMVALATFLPSLVLLIPALLLWRSSHKGKSKLTRLEAEKTRLLDELWRFYDAKTSKAIPFEYSHPTSLTAIYNIAAANGYTTLKDAFNEFERQKRLNMIYQHDAAARSAMISSGIILGAYIVNKLTPDVVVMR